MNRIKETIMNVNVAYSFFSVYLKTKTKLEKLENLEVKSKFS